MNLPIGVMDSGVGGLSVAKEIMRLLPNEKLLYFGDTANVPYGSKSPLFIRTAVFEILKYFKSQNVKAAVMACNTSSAVALEQARRCFDFPIIGVIEPGVREALKIIRTKTACMFANSVTVASGAHDDLMKKLSDNEINVTGKACPDFVPLVESGIFEGAEADRVVNKYFSAFNGIESDTLILGCTHYPFLEKAIKKAAGSRFSIVNPASATAAELSEILRSCGLENVSGLSPAHRYCVSGDPEKFSQVASMLMGFDINAELVNPSFQKRV